MYKKYQQQITKLLMYLLSHVTGFHLLLFSILLLLIIILLLQIVLFFHNFIVTLHKNDFFGQIFKM